MLDRMESDHLLEEIKLAGSELGVGEVGDGCSARPRDNRNQQNADNDRTLDAVHHEHNRQNTTTEDTNPHSRTAHLGCARTQARRFVEGASHTSSQLNGSIRGTLNQSNTSTICQADQCEVQTDSDTSCEFDRLWQRTSQPLPHTDPRQTQEYPSFDEYSRESSRVRDHAITTDSNNGVGEVCVQSHSRCKRDREVGEQTHAESRESGDGGSGGDDIAFDFLRAHSVLGIGCTEVLHIFLGAHAGSTGRRGDVAVDGYDVCHGEEGGETGADFSEEVAALPLERLCVTWFSLTLHWY